MKKNILILCLAVMITGCQQAPQEQTVNTPDSQRKDAAKKLFAQSILLLQQKDLKGAIQSLEASIKVDPADPNPYMMLGQILINGQQYDQAVIFLDQTAKNFPNNGTAFYMMSIANRMAGKNLPAVLAARRSFEIFNADGDADNAKQSALLLEALIKEAQEQENKTEAAAKTAASDAVKAMPVMKK